jgi:hypothetical protein
MSKLYVTACLTGLIFILFSFAADPPNGHTGAPGESLCNNCHSLSGSPNQGTISVEGFPSTITPEQSYVLTVVNRNTNDGAVKGGFQMTILGPNNTRAGTMVLTDSSINCAVSASAGRQYFEHHPATNYPDSNVIKWTVLWTAPILDSGSQIKWYAAGNIANGNNNTTGDRIVSAMGSGSIILSGSKELASSKPMVYPNPGTDVINIQFADDVQPNGKLYFYDILGNKVNETELHDGRASSDFLPSGVYLLEIRSSTSTRSVLWTRI